jgi:hypothetical protein
VSAAAIIAAGIALGRRSRPRNRLGPAQHRRPRSAALALLGLALPAVLVLAAPSATAA